LPEAAMISAYVFIIRTVFPCRSKNED